MNVFYQTVEARKKGLQKYFHPIVTIKKPDRAGNYVLTTNALSEEIHILLTFSKLQRLKSNKNSILNQIRKSALS